jgi:Uma2 family endonuclease
MKEPARRRNGRRADLVRLGRASHDAVVKSILESPVVRGEIYPVSVATYHTLGEMSLIDPRTELLRGVILKKMSKSPLHSTTVQVLWELLRRRLGPDFLVRKEDPLTLPDSEPEPDLAVVRGAPTDFTRTHPTTALLVVEVSIDTEDRDLAKADIYAEAGIPEYWIVRPGKKQIEVLRSPASTGCYTERVTSDGAAPIVCSSLPQLTVSPDEIFAV